MKKLIALSVSLLLIGGVVFGLYLNPEAAASIKKQLWGSDPDMPDFAAFKVNKEEFMTRRAEGVAHKRGIHKDSIFNPQDRMNAVNQLEQKEAELARTAAPQVAWTEIGPAPIPLGQTSSTRVDVSGRVSAIAIHPTNADIVYVGTAQGGVYRTTDGGTNWTALMDGAQSLAIGAIAIAPSQPETVYVGTGEPSFAVDAFFGVGIYRINNASTTATLSGPLGNAQFNGRAIGEIVVHPTDPATIFVGSTTGLGGFFQSGASPTGLPARGLYRSTDATSAAPTFTKLAVASALPDNFSARDIEIDPTNPNFLVVHIAASGGGIYVSNNALAAVPTFAHPATGTFTGTTNDFNGELSLYHVVGQPNPIIYSANGSNGGRVMRSIDNGVTFVEREDNNFCGGQCFYNIAIDVVPTNTNPDNDLVYIGGQTTPIFGRSTNGGDTFTTSQANLHADTHAIAIAPSNSSVIYHGNDGGIFKSIDGGTTWTELNNTQFSATQFISMDVHPTDEDYVIGGTQDNGTNLRNGSGAWSHADDGDGGFAVIDQNAVDTTTVTMYHTFFNQTNAMGYGRTLTTATANPVGWTYHGCGFGGFLPNGMTCTATATLFYAPMERGPGTPNTLYFGSDVLYRSSDNGTTMVKVSQEPIASGDPISAIGISPQNDGVRIVGTALGKIFGTGPTPGATTLVNLDPSNVVPNNFISRVVIDPNNVNTAYVTLTQYNVVNIWKTTTLSSIAEEAKSADGQNLAPTWTPANNGLPLVPVNAFIIDPVDSNRLYAGTDIGVYTSPDAGANWIPYGTGLPRIAVFDMAITAGNSFSRRLRVATHGRGMWDILPVVPSAANVSISGRVMAVGRAVARANVSITDSAGNVRRAITNAFGYYRFDEVGIGQNYIIQASSKRFHFAPQVVFVDSETNVDFSSVDTPGAIGGK